jgi:RNA polymerase-binding transcription factor DksA
MSINTEESKKRLEKEKQRLEANLGTVGVKKPQGLPGDYQVTPPEFNELKADKNEMADRVEELSERKGLEGPLEERLSNVNKALQAIADGSYGKCSVGDREHDIPEGRLLANPAATTCIDHAVQ